MPWRCSSDSFAQEKKAAKAERDKAELKYTTAVMDGRVEKVRPVVEGSVAATHVRRAVRRSATSALSLRGSSAAEASTPRWA